MLESQEKSAVEGAFEVVEVVVEMCIEGWMPDWVEGGGKRRGSYSRVVCVLVVLGMELAVDDEGLG